MVAWSHYSGGIVSEHEKGIADFAAHGVPVIQSGRIDNNPGVRFAYFATEAPISAFMENCLMRPPGDSSIEENVKSFEHTR